MVHSYIGFPNKQYETSRISSNVETRAMYTGVVDQNRIINFFRSIGYPTGPQSKFYGDNQATIKIILANITTLQAIPINVLITALHGI